MTPESEKQGRRRALLAARRNRSPEALAHARAALTEHLLAALDGLVPGTAAAGRSRTVAAYWPLPSEPLAPDLIPLLARRGWRVLLPVTVAGAALDWAVYHHDDDAVLAPGPFGTAEPSGPRLGAEAVCDAAAVLVPALAVDVNGVRLGRGGGFYDRTLAVLARCPASASPTEPVSCATIAVVFDDEYPIDVPCENHDAPVGWVATPSAGVRRAGRSTADVALAEPDGAK